jgi:predicted DCC family thiol-disulfide oxidoreductase YuxK
MAKTTVYYDGDCPLCRAEIAQYARLDEAGMLDLVNVADPASELPGSTSRADALARFHATSSDGRLLSGARAFVEVWQNLPGWRWLARFARLPGAIWLMEAGYRMFLPLRPAIVRLFVAVTRRRGA